MLKVAVLGAGFMGKTHINCYKNNKLCKVEHVFDKNLGLAGEAAEKCGARPADDIRMLFESDIDMVDICLPTFLHREYIELAAKAGKHILCEKPIALNLEEADSIIRITGEHGVKFMIAHVIRFWPEYMYIKKVVEDGSFGMPVSATAGRMQPIPTWSAGDWIVKPELSVGGVVDLQIHDLDFISWIMGSPSSLKSAGVKSEYGGWENVHTIMHHKGGMISSIEACNLMPRGYGFRAKFKLLFTEGCIEFDSGLQKSLVVYNKEKPPEYPVLDSCDGYQNEIDYFIECVVNDREITAVTPGDARNALYLALKSMESLETNREVFI
jgi:predicted dehydrogenase